MSIPDLGDDNSLIDLGLAIVPTMGLTARAHLAGRFGTMFAPDEARNMRI